MGNYVSSGKVGKLILFTANYPNTNGEVFVENEIRVLEKHFSKIIIICATEKKKEVNRYIPQNAEIFVFDENLSISQKLKGIPFLLKKVFWQEIAFARRTLQIKFKFIHCKILFIDLIKGYLLSKYAEEICNNHQSETTYCYAYWSDYKAAACVFLKKRKTSIKTLARNHGWDIYFYVHDEKYLPLRKFIFDRLDAIFCISAYGVDYLRTVLKFQNSNFYVARLGTYNDFPQNEVDLNSDVLLMVSCSNMVPIKRIEFIIDSLSLIKNIPIKWVHFGDGILKEFLSDLAAKILDPIHVKFEFRGQTINDDILGYYKTTTVDFLINVSESEGIPVSMMEAMSFGIPVIATNVGGTAEIVKHGINGFLLSANPTPVEIADVITFYHNLPLADKFLLRQNAYSTWNKDFNAKINYKEFAGTILSL